MIKLFAAQGFGCLKQVEVELTPLHAFIGPNDSGKSTLLKAIDGFSQYASQRLRDGVPYLNYLPQSPHAVILQATNKGNAAWRVMGARGNVAVDAIPNQPVISDDLVKEQVTFRSELGGTRMARLDPDSLRKPSRLIPYCSETHGA